MNLDGAWQGGPGFLGFPESGWPMRGTLVGGRLPELVGVASTMTGPFGGGGRDPLASGVGVGGCSDFGKTNQSDSQNFDDVLKKTEILLQTRRTVTNSK